MYNRSSLATFVIVMGVAISLPLSSGAAHPESSQPVLIENSGSSNRPGMHISIDRSGRAQCTTASRRFVQQSPDPAPQERKIDDAVVGRLYSALEAAKPLATLPKQHCMKSASFGTVLTVEWGGERTPDLNCGDGGDPRMRDLIRTVKEVEALFR